MNEIEEFYSYVEMPQVAENLKAWTGSFPGGGYYIFHAECVGIEQNPEWIRTEVQKRKAHVEVLLESLEHRDAEVRFTNARRLFYILQGDIYLSTVWALYTENIPRNVCGDHVCRTSAPLDIRKLQSRPIG